MTRNEKRRNSLLAKKSSFIGSATGVDLPTFYELIFCMKVFCPALFLLTVWLCNFLAQDYWFEIYLYDVGKFDSRWF